MADELVERLGAAGMESEFQPSDADKQAAFMFFSQLRSRIETGPLPNLFLADSRSTILSDG